MKILQHQVGVLTNCEVMQVLQDRGCDTNDPSSRALPSEREVYAYLQENSAGTKVLPKFQEFLDALQPFKLTKAEIVQISNLRPTQMVELYVVIEKCEDRLDEGQVEALLQVIAEHLGTPAPQ